MFKCSFSLVKLLVLISVIIACLLSVLELFNSNKKENSNSIAWDLIDADLKKLMKVKMDLSSAKSEFEKWEILIKFIFEKNK